MSIYVNVEGDWNKIPDRREDGYPPRVYDRDGGKWHDAKTVYVNAQGAWRQIWPIPLVTITTINVTTTGGTWPATGSTTVTIASHEEVAPGERATITGNVVVTSGAWTQTFPASQLTKTFTLPARDAGTYTVNAVWSENQAVFGQANYTIAKATPTITLTPATQTIRKGQTCTLTTTVKVGSTTLATGGSTEIRRQSTTNGTYQAWYDNKAYTGAAIARTVTPEITISWQSRITGHPNVNDATATATTTVQQKTTGYTDVAATSARTYSQNGTQIRKDGYDVYHGRYDSTYGRHYGLIWFPALASDKTCTKVELWWYPEHTFNSGADTARVAQGYHTLPSVPASIDINDARIWEGVHGHTMTRDVEFYFNASEHMVGYVNQYRSGGFGIVVGHQSDSQAWYGYGRLTRIRYTWEKWS